MRVDNARRKIILCITWHAATDYVQIVLQLHGDAVIVFFASRKACIPPAVHVAPVTLRFIFFRVVIAVVRHAWVPMRVVVAPCARVRRRIRIR